MRCSSSIHLRTFIVPNICKWLTSRFKGTKSNHVCRRHKSLLLTQWHNLLFEKMNKELTNVSNWFNADKLSLNVKKTKFSFFHKSPKKDNILLRLPNLNINGFTIEHESSIKFSGVCIDENLAWRDHIHTVENKIAKNIGLLYQGKHYLDDNCLKQIYFAYIHVYLNYANIAWASTHKTKLKKVQSKQKHALRIIFNQSKTSPSEPLFLSLNVLNFYQINIFQSVQFMHKIKNKCSAYLP